MKLFTMPQIVCIIVYIGPKYAATDDDVSLVNHDKARITPNRVWNYRIHIMLEQLIQANDLNQKISELIEKSGR